MTADGPPAPEPRSTSEAAAGLEPSRIVPALWMPVAPTLAWLAFGSAETDLDAAYYFGASIWHAAEPDRIVEWLADIGHAGTFPRDYWRAEFASLEQRVINRAAQTTSLQDAMAEAKQKRAEENARAEALGNAKPTPSTAWPKLTEAHLKEAATQLLEELEACLSDAASQHSALWAASETLRRAIANGEVRAYGWHGHGPDFSDQHKPLPLRERIPDDLCAAPVTITQHGLLSFARGDGSFGTYEVLWSGVLCDSFDVLKIKPIPDDDSVKIQYSLPRQEKQKPPPNGIGRPPREDWKQFHQELIRYLVLEEAAPSRTKTRRYMKDWADANMGESPPSDKSIEREIDKLVMDAVYAE